MNINTNMEKINYDNLQSMFISNQYYMHPVYVYYNDFKVMPDRMLFVEIDLKNLYKTLVKTLLVDESCIHKTEIYTPEGQMIGSTMMHLQNHIVLFFHPAQIEDNEKVEVLYNKSSPKEDIEKLKNIILKHPKRKPSKEPKIHLVVKDNYGLDLSPFKISKNKQDLTDNYNYDLEDFSKKMIKHINQKNQKGLFLLHGLPGTGKTSFIRHLIKSTSKKIIFLSPDLASELASPAFITFISKHTNSVLVIEDAENIIEDRKSGNNASMSNLLNLSDGLLADCFNIQIVCTFNIPITKIDKALLRKGRLTLSYEFKALETEKANALSKKLD